MVVDEEDLLISRDAKHGAVESMKLSVGAVMRARKLSAQEPVLDEAAKAAILQKEDADFWSPTKADAPVAEEKAAVQVSNSSRVSKVGKKSAPSTVIVLPSDTVTIVRAMRDNQDLSFAYQAADRGQVLGTGAQHGVSAHEIGVGRSSTL